MADALALLEIKCIDACPDIDGTIKRMAPNNLVIGLGLVAHLLRCGLTPDEVIERFRQEGR